MIKFRDRWCLPSEDNTLIKKILEKVHCTLYSIHPGLVKMYKDLKMNYWWRGMKKYVAEFVARCLTCQKVKAEHMQPQRLLQPIGDSNVEMGVHCYGLRDKVTQDKAQNGYYLGGSRPFDQKCCICANEVEMEYTLIDQCLHSTSNQVIWDAQGDCI